MKSYLNKVMKEPLVCVSKNNKDGTLKQLEQVDVVLQDNITSSASQLSATFLLA